MARSNGTLLSFPQPDREQDHEHLYIDVKERRPRWPIFLTVFSVLLCVVAIAMLALVMVECHAKAQSDDGNTLKSLPEVCLDCVTIAEHPYNMDADDPLMNKLTRRMDDGVQKCCAKTTRQMEALLEMVQRPQKTETAALVAQEDVSQPVQPSTPLKFTPVSVHKRLVAPSWNGQGDRFPKKDHILLNITKENTDLLREHARGVELTDDAIQIKYTGLYYVYSGVLFQPNFNISELKPIHKSWFHYIHRMSANNPMHTGILLKTAYSAAGSTPKETSYTGGVFRLKAGDRIQVCISGHGLISPNPESSFLGLYMLGSAEETEDDKN